MATPKWFDANAYMQNKLAQLKAQEPDAGWTLDKLYDAFREGGFVGAEGQYEHFVKFGAAEEVAPNAYFNADEYYAAKAHEYYGDKFDGSEEKIATVKAMIKDAGMNAWTHYQQFGSAEGVNPSNAFDASDYCAAKAEAMNKAGQKDPDGNDWTAESIAKAIDDAGMSVLEHYLTYAGTGEGEVAAGSTYPVSGDEQVSKPGETFYLTADRDSLVGTSGDDVFRATTAGDMDDFDTVDGGAGNDTLEVYTGDALKGTFTNIENLVVAGTAAASYDLSSFSKSFTLKADASTEVTDVTGQKLVLDGVAAKTLTVKMAADQASVELVSQNRGGDNTFSLAEGEALKSVSLTLDEAASSVKFAGTKVGSIETLAVKAVESSTANVATVDLTSLAGLKDITVTGDASVTLSAVNTATKLETLDASNTTGGVTVDGKLANTAAFTGGEGNDTITLGASTQAHDMGAGDDTVTITEALGKGVSINGGDGIDTLEMTTNIAKDFRVGDAITGFETLKLTTGTDTVDMDNFGDINHVIAGSQAATIKNIDSNGTIEFNDNGAAMTVTVKGADKADNTSDVLNVTIADDGNVTVQKLTVANVENINITADDTDLVTGGTAATHTLTLAADKATSVTVSGDAKLTLNLDAVSTAIKDINASENTGGLTVDLSSTSKGVTVTGSSAADEITLGAQTVATGGEGKDTFTVTATEMTKYATITDFGAGDKIQLKGANVTAKFGEAISLESTATFEDYVTEAVKGTSAATTNTVSWFQFTDGYTYVVLDTSNDATFSSSDMVVRLQGVSNLEGVQVTSGAFSLPEGA